MLQKKAFRAAAWGEKAHQAKSTKEEKKKIKKSGTFDNLTLALEREGTTGQTDWATESIHIWR